MQVFNIYYNSIYVILAIIAFIYAMSPKVISNDHLSKQLIIIFSFSFFILFGTRALNVGTDTFRYLRSLHNEYNDYRDFGFYILINIVKLISIKERFLLLAISFTFMLPICIYFYKINNENKILLFFIFVSLFSFKALGINIMRQGIAISLFLLSTYYIDKKKIIPFVLLSVLSFSFQASIIIPIVFYLISQKLNKIIIPITCFIIASILAFFNFDFPVFFKNIPILGSWSLLTDRLDNIIIATKWIDYYRTGFRIDFFSYNLFFTIFGLFAYKKAILIFPKYKVYLSVYLFTSSIFFLMFKYPFSDRYGLLSWVFIPFLLQPYIQKEGILNKYGRAITFFLIIAINIFMGLRGG